MEPHRDPDATLDDLLASVLEKGIVVRLELVVGVAGIPLIGVDLHAAVAAIETMLDHGIFEALDTDSRARAARDRERRRREQDGGERVLCEVAGWHWRAEGIWRSWQPARILLTEGHLRAVRPLPHEVLLEVPVTAVGALRREPADRGPGREWLHLAGDGGVLATLGGDALDRLDAALRDRLAALGETPADLPPGGGWAGPPPLAEGRLWCRGAGGDEEWKPGWARLTERELAWTADMERTVLLQIPLEDVWGVGLEPAPAGSPLAGAEVLRLSYRSGSGRAEALLSGELVSTWRSAIRRAALSREESDAGSPQE